MFKNHMSLKDVWKGCSVGLVKIKTIKKKYTILYFTPALVKKYTQTHPYNIYIVCLPVYGSPSCKHLCLDKHMGSFI